MQQGKKYEKAWQKIDVSKGRWVTFGGIVQQYGGWEWQEGVVGARSTAAKCHLLGPPWVKLDHDFSGLAFYLVLEQQFSEQFSECWSEFEAHSSQRPAAGQQGAGSGSASSLQQAQQHEQAAAATEPAASQQQQQQQQTAQPGAEAAPGAAGPPAAQGAEPPAQKRLPKPKCKAKAKAAAASGEDGGGEGAQQQKQDCGQAQKLKGSLNNTLNSVSQFCQRVHSGDAKYVWAANPQNVGELERAATRMRESIGSFGQDAFTK